MAALCGADPVSVLEPALNVLKRRNTIGVHSLPNLITSRHF